MKAIIPAAGLGTRFLPSTKCTPKEMLPVLDKPVIQYVVEEALEPDEVTDAIIVTSPNKPELLNYFQSDLSLEQLLRARGKDAYADAVAEAGGLPVDFRFQYKPKGLGHAIRSAADAVAGESFLVLLGDYVVPNRDICDKMLEVSSVHGGASVIAVAPCAPEEGQPLRRHRRRPRGLARGRRGRGRRGARRGVARLRPRGEARCGGRPLQPLHRGPLSAEPARHGPARGPGARRRRRGAAHRRHGALARPRGHVRRRHRPALGLRHRHPRPAGWPPTPSWRRRTRASPRASGTPSTSAAGSSAR